MLRFLPRGRWIWKSLILINKIFFLVGVPWNKFYAVLLDRIERDNDIEKVLARGRLKAGSKKHKGLYDVAQGEKQLELLRVLGLKSRSSLLELGLGYGRSAIPIIKFLHASRYHGTEISSRRMAMCRDWIKIEKLDKKRPNLVLVNDNSLSEFKGKFFDFIWAQGVITHMPDHEFVRLLKSLKGIMNSKSRFVFNFGVSNSGKCVNQNLKDFYYHPDYMFRLCRSEGYVVEEIDVWHEYLHFGIDRKKNMALSLTVGST